MRKFAIILSSLIAVFAITLTPVTVHAGLLDSFKSSACDALNAKDDPSTRNVDESKCEEGSGSAINNLLKIVLNIFSFVVGVIAIIILIISGIKFITSQGDAQSIAGARNTIVYALIGLVVVALAQLIVRVVLSRLSQA